MKAKILDNTSNPAIVQLPMRKSPGIVIQGDTLSVILSNIKDIKEQSKGDENLMFEIDELYNRFSFLLDHYEVVLAKNSIPLPYSKS